MKFKLLLLHYLLIFSGSLFSQCFDSGGIGDFEKSNLTTDYVAGDQGNGSFSVSAEEKVTGDQSLKVNVTTAGTWQVRLYNNSTCNFSKSVKESFVVSLYLKGEVGDVVNVSIMDNTAVDQQKDITITSSNWTLYKVPFQSGTGSTQGRIKLIFTDIGTYYVDDLQLNAFDCHGEASGSANYDDCGICAGGNTGITAINSCSFSSLDLTSTDIIYEGALEKELSANKATLYRLKKSYATNATPGYFTQERAIASSGIVVKFKTASPIVKLQFQENLTLGPDIYWHTFDIYKDGVFQSETQGFDIELSNPTGQLSEWAITLPIYSMIELTKLELLSGFTLEPITSSKPVYIAIGNSITHGQGVTNYSANATYPFIVADSLDYELYNWGIGGSKIYDGILDNFSTGIQPSLVTILWGYNDVHYSGSDDYLATNTFPMYEKILDTIATNYPSACIMAILPTYTTTPTNTTVRTIDSLRSGQLAIIQNLQKKHANISYMNGENYTDANGLNDVVHLNEQGNLSLAHGIISELPCGGITSNSYPLIEDSNVYPNPTSSIVKWKTRQQYKLVNLGGQILLQGYANSLNLINLETGIYFLQFEHGTRKVVKN